MKAIICTQYGPPEVLKLAQVAKPAPANNEILVKVHAATATTAGLSARTGKPVFARLFSGLTKPKRNILGVEFSGEVAAVGQMVESYKVGDRVFGMTGATTPGAYAEYLCMPASGAVLPMPPGITYEAAAAIVEGGLTALNFLHNKVTIRAGQHVLIYGASGSVGTASIQVAKYFGADVTAVCSAANIGLVSSIGMAVIHLSGIGELAGTVVPSCRQDNVTGLSTTCVSLRNLLVTKRPTIAFLRRRSPSFLLMPAGIT